MKHKTKNLRATGVQTRILAAHLTTRTIDSPVGNLCAFASGGELVGLAFPSNAEAVTRELARRDYRTADHPRRDLDELLLDEVERQLDLYFTGKLRKFELPIRTSGTAFQESIWKSLRQLPWGTTTTYGDLARNLKRPGSARAIGMANARNPIAIIIPCHRVTGARNKIKGFAGGSAAVRGLLAIERISEGLP